MKVAALRLIQVYQRTLSPMMPARCRFAPTCSQYAWEAIARHGLVKGGLLAAWRLARCHPLNRGGYDPVPGRDGRKVSSAPPAP